MPKKRLALERGGPERLEISWGLYWKNLRVCLDGVEIGTVPGQNELKAGQEFPLGDGSTVQVQLVNNYAAPELQVLRNGVPLPGSDSDPEARVRTAAGIVYFIGGLSVLLGLVVLLFGIESLRAYGMGGWSIFFGAIFLGLGYGVQKRSSPALFFALGLFILDGLLMIPTYGASGRPPIGPIIFRIFLIARMTPAIGAIRTLKQEPQDVYAGA